MKCFKCEHVNTAGSQFCSKCGRDFHSKKNNHKKSQPDTQKFPEEQAVSMYNARLQEKKYNSAFVAIVYLFAVGLTYYINAKDMHAFLIISGIISMFALVGFFQRKHMTYDYYYTIPTSKDINGQHQCILCGNKGIYKSTIYRTSTVVHSCSKCSQPLFYN